MSIFDERKRGFENRFAYEEEKAFKMSSLQTRMMAAWAADVMGKTGQDAETYVDQIIQEKISGRFDGGDPFTLLDRLAEDLGHAISEHTLTDKMEAFETEARMSIEEGA